MIRLGMIGTGRIARRFVPEAETVSGIQLCCVYNPHFKSAKAFAEEFSILLFTDRLEELAEACDAVYIAAPHQTHFEYARFLLEKGKHVLCEKPLCLEERQARELFDLADKHSCILMEAIKTACCPGFLSMMETAAGGLIGEIRDVESCFTRLTDRNTREFLDLTFGGSLTEFGSYTLLPVIRLMGTGFRKVIFQSVCDGNGIDEYTKTCLEYERGMGLSKTGLAVKSEGQLVIAGTKGYILSESPWWLTRKFEVRFEDPSVIQEHVFSFEGQGLRYEVEAFRRAICGECSPGGPTREESIALAGIMERFLSERQRA